MSKNVGQKILDALAGGAMSDKDLSRALNIPEPSIRRTRLHLEAAGKVKLGMRDGMGVYVWTLNTNNQPSTYMGTQDISVVRNFSTRSDS